MTLVKYLGIAFLATSFPFATHAQDSGTYGAIGVASYGEFETFGVDIKLGHDFSKNFGIEVQGIKGLTTDSTKLCSAPSCATFKQEIEYTIGAFAVGRLPLSEQFEIFARGGLHNSKYKYEINNALNSMLERTDTGVAVGAGIQYNFNTKNAIRLETTYLESTDIQTSVVSFVRTF